MCTTRSDSLPEPQGGEWGSLREGPESLAQHSHRIENKIVGHAGHKPVGHGKRGLVESVTFGGNRLGKPREAEGPRIGRCAGIKGRGEGERRAPCPRLRVGEAPAWAGLGDAADRGTQGEPKNRKRKFACLSLSLSIGQWGRSCPPRCPETAHLFLPFPFSGGRRGRGGQGRLRLCPARRWTCADWGPGRSPRETGLGRAALAPAAAPFGSSFPPALYLARLSPARLLCARGVLTAHRGRSGAPARAAPILSSQPSS